MVKLLKQVGTTAWKREVLKIYVKTYFSWSVQLFRAWPGTLSCMETFRGLEKALLALSAGSCSTWSVGGGISLCTFLVLVNSDWDSRLRLETVEVIREWWLIALSCLSWRFIAHQCLKSTGMLCPWCHQSFSQRFSHSVFLPLWSFQVVSGLPVC